MSVPQPTIVALATPPGRSAIALIRLSGSDAIALVQKVFKGKDLEGEAPNTIHFGTIHDEGKLVDEVLVSLFKAPHSFTKEDSIEISCHGSPFIVQKIIELLIDQGARPAQPGEFTKRAFLAGRFDLSGAEAVADLIEAETTASHRTALHHMRGGIAHELKQLRQRLMQCASLLELSLDFSEQDVTFASEQELLTLVQGLLSTIRELIGSFSLGNVIKHGVATVIAGKPNVGKSTLLNALLGEERALVSDIAGTTRDVIEGGLVLGGITFRFLDTAGLRQSNDKVETMGIARAYEQMKTAHLILYVIDLSSVSVTTLYKKKEELTTASTPYLLIGNKMDKASEELQQVCIQLGGILVAAKHHKHIKELKEAILDKINAKRMHGNRTIVVNTRHYHSLIKAEEALEAVKKGVSDKLTPDLLALQLRHALHHLGTITGEVTTDEILSTIFSKFCIGK